MGYVGKVLEILIVEDNPGDIRIIQESFKEMGLPNILRVVKNGVEALQYLRRQGRYAEAQAPDLIILDWNMPMKNGREVLLDIKSDPALKRIPVVVLTSSEADDDIFQAYDLHANCCVTKPGNLDEFIKVVHAIESYWSGIAKLPPA